MTDSHMEATSIIKDWYQLGGMCSVEIINRIERYLSNNGITEYIYGEQGEQEEQQSDRPPD